MNFLRLNVVKGDLEVQERNSRVERNETHIFDKPFDKRFGG